MDDRAESFGGVDWAWDGHAACVVGAGGEVLDRFSVEHPAKALEGPASPFLEAGVRRVAVERPDGPVVDALMEAGLDVVVVSSRAVNGLRSRYGSAGNKPDASDAYVPLRSHVRARKDLVATRVAVANQLRSHLLVVLPGGAGLFRDVDSPVSLRILRRFPSASRAAWLSERRLGSWLRANGSCGRPTPEEMWARLDGAPRGLLGDGGDAMGSVTLAFVAALESVRAQIDELDARFAELLHAHPDGPAFRSLPRSGTVRAATLPAEIGDCRSRFPTPESLACLASATPSTRESGKHRVVTFRWACDKKLRDAVMDFAGDSTRGSEWAAERCRRLRVDGKRHPHAQRVLARACLHVIWRCRQDGMPYDPARHGAFQRLLAGTA